MSRRTGNNYSGARWLFSRRGRKNIGEVEGPPMPVTREGDASPQGPLLGRTPADRADEPRLPVESQGPVVDHPLPHRVASPARKEGWEKYDGMSPLEQRHADGDR